MWRRAGLRLGQLIDRDVVGLVFLKAGNAFPRDHGENDADPDQRTSIFCFAYFTAGCEALGNRWPDLNLKSFPRQPQ